jgi:hypothetical protein
MIYIIKEDLSMFISDASNIQRKSYDFCMYFRKFQQNMFSVSEQQKQASLGDNYHTQSVIAENREQISNKSM